MCGVCVTERDRKACTAGMKYKHNTFLGTFYVCVCVYEVLVLMLVLQMLQEKTLYSSDS